MSATWNAAHSTPAPEDNMPTESFDRPLPTPESFPAFPYSTPYSIQISFMQELFQCIDQKKIGIFESPTGTGKSLSMICGAVGWLLDHEKAVEAQVEEEESEGKDKDNTTKQSSNSADDTPDWVQNHRVHSDAARERQDRRWRKEELDKRIEKIRDREAKLRQSMQLKAKRQAMGLNGSKNMSRSSKYTKIGDDDEDEQDDDGEFLLDEYFSDGAEDSAGKMRARMARGGKSKEDYGNVSKEVLELMERFNDREESIARKHAFGKGSTEEDEEPDVLKIYYCSRTHSQLSQFISELRKTSYGEHLHVITLGSRKALCINQSFRDKASLKPFVRKGLHSSGPLHEVEPIVSASKLNDVCLDAQKSGTPTNHRCEFLPRVSASSTSYIAGTSGDISGSSLSERSGLSFGFGQDGDGMEGDEKLLNFRDHALAKIRDIEELAELGSELETCPYYGSRKSVRQCQIVTLPYNLLLHASTRDSLKLIIKDNILLLDEAHNLIDSLLQMHSVSLPLPSLLLAQEQLGTYLKRYETRLSATNEGYIRVLMRVLKALEMYVGRWAASASAPGSSFQDKVLKVNEFLHQAGMDHINLFKAHEYLSRSGIPRKLQAMHESLLRAEEKRQSKAAAATAGGSKGVATNNRPSKQPQSMPLTSKFGSAPVLLAVDAFLVSLLNFDNDGRVILTLQEDVNVSSGSVEYEEGDTVNDTLAARQSSANISEGGDRSELGKPKKPVLKFMLLNPANVFRPLVEEARSIILAGGTMEPVSGLLSHLFPYLREQAEQKQQHIQFTYPRIHRFSCGHVIPPENLLALVLEKSPTNASLELNFVNRNQPQVMDEVGKSLVNLLGLIPDGVVVFFVSYGYMDQVLKRWQQQPKQPPGSTVATSSIMDRIRLRKRIFIEPREAVDSDRMLKAYQDCILEAPEHKVTSVAGSKGAVLFSVVGGKMSEGINFSDRLGRGVVMVGLPFPNKNSMELQERMRYMDELELQDLNKLNSHFTPSARPSLQTPATAGSEYYEDLCMRAVNQSIGRAIRHQNDYAVIVLMDKRFSSNRIKQKLPDWIRKSAQECPQFGPAVAKVSQFFRSKK